VAPGTGRPVTAAPALSYRQATKFRIRPTYQADPATCRVATLDEKEILAERFEANRAHLRAIAYRMLGSRNEADDAVA
jgi:hypothetical protein